MFERFTERARQVVVFAQEEARNFRHSYIGTEHLLLGLLREEEGLGARVLNQLGVTETIVHDQVERIVGPGEEGTPVEGQIPFTPRAKTVLELALREALSLGHNYIGTEHLLLGLVRDGEGVGCRILTDLEASHETIRNEVIRMLSGPSGRRRSRTNELEQERKHAELFAAVYRVELTPAEHGHLIAILGERPINDEVAFQVRQKLQEATPQAPSDP